MRTLGVLGSLGLFWGVALGAFAAGIVLFSFSLYLIAWSGIKWLAAITPLGGLCFLAGHVLMILAFWKHS